MNLTSQEAGALVLTSALANLLSEVVGHGSTRRDDLAELFAHIHAIQHAIMAQPFARAHPDRYRELGGEFRIGELEAREAEVEIDHAAKDGLYDEIDRLSLESQRWHGEADLLRTDLTAAMAENRRLRTRLEGFEDRMESAMWVPEKEAE